MARDITGKLTEDFNANAPDLGAPIQITNRKFDDISTEYKVEANPLRKEKLKGVLLEMNEMMDEIDALMTEALQSSFTTYEEYEPIFTAITMYGNQPLAEMGESSRKQIAVQQSFDEQVKIYGQTLEGLAGTMENVKGFVKETGKVFERAKKAGAKGIGFMGQAFSWMTGGKEDKTDEQKYLDEVSRQLPEKQKSVMKIEGDLVSIENSVNKVITQAMALGLERMTATEKLDTYICATSEVARRFNEEYVPEAQKRAQDTQSPADAMKLEIVSQIRQDFMQRVVALNTSRLNCTTSANDIKDMVDMMRKQKGQLLDMRVNSVPEWLAMISQAGIAASSLKVAVFIQKGQKIGDDTWKQMQDVLQKTHTMTLDAANHGSGIKLELLLEAAELSMKRANEKRDNAQKMLDQSNASIKVTQTMIGRLIENRETNEKLLLEGTAQPGTAKARVRALEHSKPAATNDNAAEAAPNAEAAPAAATAKSTRKNAPKQ